MSGRRTKTVKRANNAAARELLEEHYRSVGLEAASPPKASLEALSKIIHSGDDVAIRRVLAGSTKYLKRATTASAAAAAAAAAPAAAAAAAATPKRKKSGTRSKAKPYTYKDPARHLRPKHHPPVQNRCMTECALKCMKESTFVPLSAATMAAAAPAMPSSTQELRAFFSDLSPPREAPVRQRLRRIGELPETPYYHQLTKTKPYQHMLRSTKKRGRPANTINYKFS